MADEKLVDLLKQGATVWNQWRDDNPEYPIDLSDSMLENMYLLHVNLADANLKRADFYSSNISFANFAGADVTGANFHNAMMTGADLSQLSLTEAFFSNAFLLGTNLTGTDLRKVNLTEGKLMGSNLSGADLRGANLLMADLSTANLRGANLSGADLTRCRFVNTDFTEATISGCRVHGTSVWNAILDKTIQSDLIITPHNEPDITVDNLEVAQFIYLLLNNQKLRGVIDTLTTKSVLILGRFTDERKAVLDAIRNELRLHGYLPILFDFEKPANRDLTETVMTLAGLSRFVIADLSDPHSIAHELKAIIPAFSTLPVQPIFCPVNEHPDEYALFENFDLEPNVLPIFYYETAMKLMQDITEKVIKPAEAKREILFRIKRDKEIRREKSRLKRQKPKQ